MDPIGKPQVSAVDPIRKLQERFVGNVESVKKRAPVCQMTFHVTDATKMLASVAKMTEAGNDVMFSKQRKSYVESATGEKAYLRKKRGIFILDVVVFDGEAAVQAEVVVDSGAADNVMPKGLFEDIVLREKEVGVNFVAADGVPIGNYGRRDVQFIPLEFWEARTGSPFQGRA